MSFTTSLLLFIEKHSQGKLEMTEDQVRGC